MAGLLQRAISERVTIVEHGSKRSISKAEAAFKQAANKAASGNMRAMTTLFQLIQASENRAVEPTAPYSAEADRATMAQLAKRSQQTLDDVASEDNA